MQRSPQDLAWSPDGRTLAVTDRTARSLVLVPADEGRAAREVPLPGEPVGVAWGASGRTAWVACRAAAGVAGIDPSTGAVLRTIPAGPRPSAIAAVPGDDRLVVGDSAWDAVLLVDGATGKTEARIAVVRDPCAVAVSPDGRRAVVANRLPADDASSRDATAAVSVVRLDGPPEARTVRLPSNSMNLQGVAISPEGDLAWVTHNLGRATLATIQVESGWISGNALSAIDLARGERVATVLLDRPGAGAANPWGVAVSPDGARLWVALSGVHQVGEIDLARLRGVLGRPGSDIAGRDEEPVASGDAASLEVVFTDRHYTYGMGLHAAGLFRAISCGLGPRGLAVHPDGRTLAAATYFAGAVALIDASAGRGARTVPLGIQPDPDEARRGELAFHDARLCHQEWLSCATCHPDGRADGLNWDLLNDGYGNPKNTRSLLHADRTPPQMTRGVRPMLEDAVEGGFVHILFQRTPSETLEATRTWIASLEPEPSPFLVDGRLGPRAERGKAVFERPDVGCALCHPAPLFTDLRSHDVGTRGDTDWEADAAYDTPTLIEGWRTAPYLHHGKARTLEEVLVEHNREDRHGTTSPLSREEIESLAEYLRSL